MTKLVFKKHTIRYQICRYDFNNNRQQPIIVMDVMPLNLKITGDK